MSQDQVDLPSGRRESAGQVRKSVALRIWLVDLTYTQQTIAADVMPNAVGGIATYTEACLGLVEPIRVFKYPETLAEALRSDIPDVIGFSNYIWNFELSYAYAEIVKRKYPGTIILFGGPNYPIEPHAQERLFREHRAIDFYIVKEGEQAFVRLIEGLSDHGKDVEAAKRMALPSVHALGSDGRIYRGGATPRIRDLTCIPSPYTTGKLDEFFDGKLLPIIQTNRGCPFTCTFCIEGDNYYNKVRKNSPAKVYDELHYIGRKMEALRHAGGRNDLFIADSNFGMYRDDLDTARALAETQSQYDWPEYINVATGKNQKERVLEASRIINGALRLSGSVQSLAPDVLKNIKRDNIDVDGLFELGLKAEELGANTYSEIILALPGDSLAVHLSTVKTVMDAGFTNIYLFQLMLLPGTELATQATLKQYGMTTRFRVLPRCYGSYELLGEQAVAGEIEEICIANSTLTFEDYLKARQLHLVVTIFYNDSVFGALVKFLRAMNIPVFDWIQRIDAKIGDSGLSGLVSAFLKDTADELWEDRAELERYIRTPGIIEKYIAGELGSNLLFLYKTLAITDHLEALADLAGDSFKAYLLDKGYHDAALMQFVDDAIAFHSQRAKNLFFELDHNPGCYLRYDIDAFLKARKVVTISIFKTQQPRKYEFVHTPEQRALIERYLGIYGNSPVSIGRILSKVHVKKIFREAMPATH